MRTREKLDIDNVVMVNQRYTKWLADHADVIHSNSTGIKRSDDYLVDKFSYTKGLPIVGIVTDYGADNNTFGVTYTNGVNKGFQYFGKEDLIKLS